MFRRRPHPRFFLACILILCAAGAWLSGELVRAHADPAGSLGRGLLGRMCMAGGETGSSCAGALTSRWAQFRVPLPRPQRDFSITIRPVTVPVAFVGLAYFTSMGVWFGLLGGPRPFGVRWQRVPLHLAFTAGATSLFYLGVMTVGAAPWCAGCLAVHSINFLLLPIVWWAIPGFSVNAPEAEVDLSQIAPARVARLTVTTREALSAAAVALLVVGGLWGYRRENLIHRADMSRLRPYREIVRTLQNDPDFLVGRFLAQPRLDVPPPAERGGVELVVFTDFECPGCYCNAQWLRNEAPALLGDGIDIRVRHYPLCRTCNDAIESAGHPNACSAARAAEAARLQGGDDAFMRMHDLLFENRSELGDPAYREMAIEIGLDAERFARDMESDAVRRVIDEDIALARRLGVVGTPTMFLDGRPVPELCQVPEFSRAVATMDWPDEGPRLAGEGESTPPAPGESVVEVVP